MTEQETALEVLPPHQGVTVVEAAVRGEFEMQLVAAHRFPRSLERFKMQARTMVTMDIDVARSCFYSVPRGGKRVEGGSIGLARICVSAWRNLRCSKRVIAVEDDVVVAQAKVMDLESNNEVTVEERRSILDSKGRRYSPDMIVVTGKAAASIAYRNAVFEIIPKPFVDALKKEAQRVAVGDQKTLKQNREYWLQYWHQAGIDEVRVLAALDKRGVEDIGLEDLKTLTGLANAVREGEISIDEAFPEPVAELKPVQGASFGVAPVAAEPVVVPKVDVAAILAGFQAATSAKKVQEVFALARKQTLSDAELDQVMAAFTQRSQELDGRVTR